MQRCFLRDSYLTIDVSNNLDSYISELLLLHYVPLSYIIADKTLLPDESIRFFYIDSNWTSALADGALSVGRITETDRELDTYRLRCSLPRAQGQLHMPRYNRMHENHRENALKAFVNRCNTDKLTVESVWTEKIVTGFVINSELVRMLKRLEVSARDGNNNEIPLLRLDTFSDEIAIGLFDGKIASVEISEPKTGLNFGLPPTEKFLVPKSMSKESFGVPLKDKKIDIAGYKNAQGRLDVSALAEELKDRLGEEIDSAKLAFQLIGVAEHAVFKEEI